MISLISTLSCLLLVLISSMYFCLFSSVGSLSINRFENPMIAFIGVLISWLILARNDDFNLSDSSALKRAAASSSVRFSTSDSRLFRCFESSSFCSRIMVCFRSRSQFSLVNSLVRFSMIASSMWFSFLIM